MAIITRRQREFYIGKGATALAYINLFSGLAVSAVSVVWAVVLNSFTGNPSITGIISGFFSFISFLSFFVFVPLVERADKKKLFSFSLIFLVFAYILFSINRNFYLFIFLGTVLVMTYAIRATASGIILKNNSKNKELALNEGFIYTFLNIGWILGPLIGAYVAASFDAFYVFGVGAFFSLIAFFVFRFSKFRKEDSGKIYDKNVIKNFINYFKDRKRALIYIVGGGANAWWVLIYIFIPLFIINKGLGERGIGLFLFFIAVPLILLEYRFGKLTEKLGYRKVFLIGLSIVFIFSILSFFADNTYYILIFLILGSSGMALLEPTTEAYFLRIVEKKDAARFYGPYNTSKELFQIAGKLITSFALIFLPFKFIFLIFALLILGVFFTALKINNH